MKTQEITNTQENTPEHCWDCWKFQECRQAQNMNANTEPVDAYMGDAEYLCKDCANGDNQNLIGNIGDSDVPEHCAICGIPLHCSLTPDGINYLKDSLSDISPAGCCKELWPVLYAEYLS